MSHTLNSLMLKMCNFETYFETLKDDTYNYRNENRQYCATLTGLRSCMKHTVEIFTSHNGIRSGDKAVVRTETLPETPQGLRMINFDSDSIHLKWENTGDSKGYLVNVKPGT